MLAWPLRLLVALYRWLLSPLLPAACRFYPSCSAYADEALKKHGFFRGGALSAWRVVRCNPFNAGGVDLVPPAHGEHPHDCGHDHAPPTGLPEPHTSHSPEDACAHS